MSGKVVNLRQARKAKARSNKRAEGDANALAFGRTKTERKLTEAKVEQAKRALDGHKREDS